MRFAEVAVDAPVGHERTFSYSIPTWLDVRVGQLVIVPFGPRELQGVVLSLPAHPQVPETREILDTYAPGPVLTDTQLRLAAWISGYYMCSLFEAAALMLPPGGRLRFKTYLTLGPNASGPEQTARTGPGGKILETLGRKKRVEEGRLLASAGRGAVAALRALVRDGLVARAQAPASHAVGQRTRQFARLTPAASDLPPEKLGALARRAPRQAALLSRLREDAAPVLLAEARREYGPSAVAALHAKGLLEKQTLAVERDPLARFSFALRAPVELTPTQERAGAEVRAALNDASARPRTFLLEGVTGSGKTEVYLDAVQDCLELRKKAIVLVPEIALTHQTVERFASAFPGQVAVLHSGLSAGERFDQWWKIRRGEYGVVIGSRGAVFAPQPDLGLIVVDEEHEWTYKQHDASPRYHARDVALRLAELAGGVVVLGSATPDVGSYRKAQRGAFRLLRIPNRFYDKGNRCYDNSGRSLENSGRSFEQGNRSLDKGGVSFDDGGRPLVRKGAGSGPAVAAGLAAVEVVDMRRELREGNRLVFSRALMREMGQCLEAGSQAVLFLNRRGSASNLQCRSCGFSLRCRRCDIPMVYHRDADRMRCHYCGDRRIPPPRCPQCRGFRMAYYGKGTQSVVAELSRQYPGAKTLRWDRDSAGSPAAHERLLHQFRSGDAQVLVGTQMIAKGLHFPSVTLVGVVLADLGLNVPDYRAGERTFQLLSQVAGRAGRGQSEGRVVIQTYQPDNYAIKAAATQDYQRFYREEVAYRREQGNPPFSRLIRLLYTHTNGALCEREARRLAGLLREQRDSWGYSDTEVLGPTPAHPARVRGRYRWQLILRAAEPRTLLDKVAVPQGWVVDVDPVGTG